MRYILLLISMFFLNMPAHAEDNFEKVTMPAIGWPSDYEVLRAQDLIAQKNWEDAISVLEGVLNRNVKSIDGHVLSGYAQFKLNNIERARKHLYSAIDLDPRHMGAHLYLAEMDLQEGNIKKVEERLQLLKIICKGTNCAEYQYLKRQLLIANKDDDKDKTKMFK